MMKVLFRSRDGIQYVEHAEGHGDRMFVAACDLGLEGIVSKKLNAPYRSGPSKNWLKIKNPQSAGSNPRAGWYSFGQVPSGAKPPGVSRYGHRAYAYVPSQHRHHYRRWHHR